MWLRYAVRASSNDTLRNVDLQFQCNKDTFHNSGVMHIAWTSPWVIEGMETNYMQKHIRKESTLEELSNQIPALIFQVLWKIQAATRLVTMRDTSTFLLALRYISPFKLHKSMWDYGNTNALVQEQHETTAHRVVLHNNASFCSGGK